MVQSVHKDHYLDHLAAVNRHNRVVATKDIKNEQGALLVAKGTAITPDIARKIAHHKLTQPLDTSVSLERALAPAQIFERLETLQRTSDLRHMREQNKALDEIFYRRCEALALYPSILQKITVFSERLPLFFDNTLISTYIALLLAAELKIDEEPRNTVFLAAISRDLGLLHIDPEIVQKKQPLTPQEWRLLQGHVAVSHYFLTIVPKLPKQVSRAVLEHHERTDGLGYPCGRLADQLCAEGQVVAIADMIVGLLKRQVDGLGYSLRTLIPILQLNISVHFNHFTEAAIRVLRSIPPTGDRVYDESEIPAVIDNIVARLQPLAAWFDEICALIGEISELCDNRHIRATNALLARIQASLISSGLITDEQRRWLEDVAKHRRVEEYFDVECAELMLDEIGWQFRHLCNTLTLAIEDETLQKSAGDRFSKQLSQLYQTLDNLLSFEKNAA